MTTISYRDIFELYAQTIDGLKQQLLPGEYEQFLSTFPRDPIKIARGLEAVYAVKIFIKPRDFYQDIQVPDESRDLFCFHEHHESGEIHVFINTNVMEVGRPLISRETLRFMLMKEIFIAVIRKDMIRRGLQYPDTVDYGPFGASILDIISEKPSIYDIGGEDDSPVPSVENAAEILSLMFLIDMEEVFLSRKALVEENGDLGFTLFDYRKLSRRYDIRVRFVSIFMKTEFINRAVEGLRSLIADFRKLFPKINWD